MSASGWLAAAKFGVDVLGAYSQYSSQMAEAEVGAIEAEMTGQMERYQIRRQAEVMARNRRKQFADYVGAQRVATATAGITGGRTARMIEAESQTGFSRQEELAEESQRFATRRSLAQERQRKRGARFAMQQARSQFGLDVLSSALGAAKSGVAASQSAAAAGG